jgi:hypothetical protein
VWQAKKIPRDRVREKVPEASVEQKRELLQKEKVNITDPDAHIMQQANGEKNPAYSITTTTDVGHDILTHIQVNAQDNDAAALGEAIKAIRLNTEEKHEEVEAHAGFASMENYESLEAEGQQALIPDRRMDVEERGTRAKGEYDRSKFSYIESSDTYRCAAGKVLKNTGTVEVNRRSYDRYENGAACAACAHRSQCTRCSHRRVL